MMSNLRSFSEELRGPETVSESFLISRVSVTFEGMRKIHATDTGMVTMVVKKNTQCQETYWTKIAPMMSPRTKAIDQISHTIENRKKLTISDGSTTTEYGECVCLLRWLREKMHDQTHCGRYTQSSDWKK